MSIGETCPKCGFIHCARDVRSLGSRFKPDGPRVYQWRYHGDTFASREEAEADLCATRAELGLELGFDLNLDPP